MKGILKIWFRDKETGLTFSGTAENVEKGEENFWWDDKMEFWSSRQDVWFRDDLIIGFIFHHPEEIDESGREKGKVTIEMENGK